jgi:hypothetical protein
MLLSLHVADDSANGPWSARLMRSSTRTPSMWKKYRVACRGSCRFLHFIVNVCDVESQLNAASTSYNPGGVSDTPRPATT